MADKITGLADGQTINCKRFYLPGVTIETECPTCGQKYVTDLGRDYLMYPLVNKPYEHYYYCGECDIEWSVPILLKISLELADK